MSEAKMKGPLAVTVHRAESLQDVQTFGKQDPFCVLNVGSETFKTKVHENGGRNPVWEQAFMFNLDGKEDFLHILIKDKDIISDDSIGRCDVSLVALAETSDPQWFQVVDRGNFQKLCGKIQLTGQFSGTGGPKDRKKEEERLRAQEKQKYEAELKKLEAANQQLLLQQQAQAIALQQQQLHAQQELLLAQQRLQQQPQQAIVIVAQQPQHQQQTQSTSEAKTEAHHAVSVGKTVQLQTYHGKWLCAQKDTSVVADRDTPQAYETFSVENHGHKIALKTYHGLYVCAEQDGRIVADREKVGAWEQFDIARHRNGISIKSAHGKFLCAEPSTKVAFDRDVAKEWETFVPHWGHEAQSHQHQRLPSTVTFKSHHGKFICAEKNQTVVVNRDHAKEWETWTAEHIGGNKYHFKSYHGKYLCAEKDHSMTANRDKPQGWETFTVEGDNNHFTIKTFHGRYVCAEPSGKLVADREKAAQWETFTIL